MKLCNPSYRITIVNYNIVCGEGSACTERHEPVGCACGVDPGVVRHGRGSPGNGAAEPSLRAAHRAGSGSGSRRSGRRQRGGATEAAEKKERAGGEAECREGERERGGGGEQEREAGVNAKVPYGDVFAKLIDYRIFSSSR